MFRTALVALLAVFAFAAVGTASASAQCPDSPTEGDVALCKGHVEQTGTFPFTSELKEKTTVLLEVAGGMRIVCKKATTKGNFNASADSNLKVDSLVLTFNECEITNTAETKANCEVVTPMVSKNLAGTFTGAAPTKIRLKPATGTEWFTFTIKNRQGKNCVFKNTGSKIVGEQECNLPSPEMEAVKHELQCLPSGSKLTFAGKNVKFEMTETIGLAAPFAGQEWGLYAS